MTRRRRPRSISNDATVRQFVPAVERYCLLLETGTRRRKAFLRQVAELLPELFHLAIQLPTGRASERIRRELSWISTDAIWPLDEKKRRIARESIYRHTVIPAKRFFAISKRLAVILGDWDRYREVFDPYKDKDLTETSVSNGLAEIWHDLKPKLLLFKMGDETSMRHAVHQWALHVRLHWGPNHFTGAMNAILFALAEIDDDWQFPEFARRKQPRRHAPST